MMHRRQNAEGLYQDTKRDFAEVKRLLVALQVWIESHPETNQQAGAQLAEVKR